VRELSFNIQANTFCTRQGGKQSHKGVYNVWETKRELEAQDQGSLVREKTSYFSPAWRISLSLQCLASSQAGQGQQRSGRQTQRDTAPLEPLWLDGKQHSELGSGYWGFCLLVFFLFTTSGLHECCIVQTFVWIPRELSLAVFIFRVRLLRELV
jgi:hypothetical protein